MINARAGTAWLLAVGLTVLSLCLSATSSASVVFLDSGLQAYSPYRSSIEAKLGKSDPEREIVVTFGEAAFSEALSKYPDTPILALLILSPSFDRILDAYGSSDIRKVSAIFVEPSPEYQILLADLIAPSRTKLIALTHGSASSFYPDPSSQRGLDIVTFPAGDTKRLLANMERFDILIARPDSSLYNHASIQPIVRSLYRRQKYLIGYSSGMTNAGALASVAIEKEDVLTEVDKALATFFEDGVLPPPSYSSSFKVYVNDVLLRSLGLHKRDPEELERDIKKISEGEHD